MLKPLTRLALLSLALALSLSLWSIFGPGGPSRITGADMVRFGFLILGADGGTYYITERDLVKQNHDAIVRCIKLDGVRAVKRIVEISDSGRAPKTGS